MIHAQRSAIGNPTQGSDLPIAQILHFSFTATFGAITALTGTKVTQAITGLKTTDVILVQCFGVITLGAAIANARCSVDGTLEIEFTTAVAIGVTLGSLTYHVVAFRSVP